MTRDSAIVVSLITGLAVAGGMGFLVLNPPRFLGESMGTLISLAIFSTSLIGLIEGAIVGRQARQVRRGIIGGIVGAILGAIVAVGMLLQGGIRHAPPRDLFLTPLPVILGASVGAIISALRATRERRNVE